MAKGVFIIYKKKMIAQYAYGKNEASNSREEALEKAEKYVSNRKDSKDLTIKEFNK